MSEMVIGPCVMCGKCMTECVCKTAEEKPSREWRVRQVSDNEHDLYWIPGEFVERSALERVQAESKARDLAFEGTITKLEMELAKALDQHLIYASSLNQAAKERDQAVAELEAFKKNTVCSVCVITLHV